MKLDELHRLTSGISQMKSIEDQLRLHTLLREAGVEPESFYQDMEMTSKFVDTHQDISYVSSPVNLHSHVFYEILYCRSAQQVDYLVGANRYRLQEGDIIIVPPEVSHCPILPPLMTIPYRRDVLWISPELMEGIIQDFSDDLVRGVAQSFRLRTDGTKWAFLGEMFSYGIQESQRRVSGWEAAVLGNTISLLVQLRRALRDWTAEPLPAEKPELLDRVMAYIEQNISRKITLSETARNFFVSESTISHTFKEKMGVSFYRCVTQRRLIAAKALILDGHPLENVGQQVGFSDYSSFYRAFKQEYGIPPRQYRKLQELSESSV